MRISFLGAAQTVTGSKFFLAEGQKSLFIDCGLFQGLKTLRLKNREPLPDAALKADAVVLTHAHIDHSGYVPLFVKQGFAGPIHCTEGTNELCKILLPDSGYLQEEEARYFNKYQLRRNKQQAEPLYTEEDARHSLNQFVPHPFHKTYDVAGTFQITHRPAGHIVGSSSVLVTTKKSSILFSGDVGRQKDTFMKPPESACDADYLVIESTYGNRRHKDIDPSVQLEEIINRTAKRGGTILIPTFAVGRAQALLHLILELKNARRIPLLPIYLNSPMATDASALYCRFADEHILTPDQCRTLCKNVEYVRSAEESKALNERRGPMIILSASGMATGGRVLHHLKTVLPDAKNTVLFAGFQAAGTRGDALTHGADHVKIHGQYIDVRAEVALIDTLSAHADYVELLEWMKGMKRQPKKIFIVHGEPAAQDAMRREIKDAFGWESVIPAQGESFEL